MTRSSVACFVLLALTALASCARTPDYIVLATTTSVGQTGLLDAVLPQYAAAEVRPLLVGSGRALELLARGEADVVISHAPAREARTLEGHQDWYYRKILFNDFLLAGPQEDPARVAEAASAADAMRRIAEADATFLSRGDESGTHERERALWNAARIPSDRPRIVIAGAGMGQTLRVASSTGAYTLTDRATFESLRNALQLAVLFEGDPELLNTYAVLARPDRPRGEAFARWLADGEGYRLMQQVVRERIRGFSAWPAGMPRDRVEARPR